jgi:hypothetical protein
VRASRQRASWERGMWVFSCGVGAWTGAMVCG